MAKRKWYLVIITVDDYYSVFDETMTLKALDIQDAYKIARESLQWYQQVQQIWGPFKKKPVGLSTDMG